MVTPFTVPIKMPIPKLRISRFLRVTFASALFVEYMLTPELSYGLEVVPVVKNAPCGIPPSMMKFAMVIFAPPYDVKMAMPLGDDGSCKVTAGLPSLFTAPLTVTLLPSTMD